MCTTILAVCFEENHCWLSKPHNNWVWKYSTPIWCGMHGSIFANSDGTKPARSGMHSCTVLAHNEQKYIRKLQRNTWSSIKNISHHQVCPYMEHGCNFLCTVTGVVTREWGLTWSKGSATGNIPGPSTHPTPSPHEEDTTSLTQTTITFAKGKRRSLKWQATARYKESVHEPSCRSSKQGAIEHRAGAHLEQRKRITCTCTAKRSNTTYE